MRNGFLVGVAVVLTIAGMSLAEDQIRLKSRRFVPSKGITTGANAKIEAARVRGGAARVIIQLDRKMTRPYRKSLKAQGVKLLGYIPERAWFAAVDPSIVGDITKIEGIRAVCEILPQDKIAPSIRKYGINDTSMIAPDKAKLLVIFFADVSFSEAEALISAYGGRVLGRTKLLHGLIIQLRIEDIQDVAAENGVKWIDQHYETVLLNNGARSAVGANAAQDTGLTGNGVVVGVWDGGCIDPNHDDVAERVTDANCGSTISGHATHVTGTIIGDGSIDPNYKGMAPEANVVSYYYWTDANEAESDYNEAIGTYRIDLSNNSWGRQLGANCPPDCNHDYDGTYDWDAKLEDEIVSGRFGKRISIVFASGNDADIPLNCPNGPFGCLRGTAVAKNVIVVGASNSADNSVAPFSNRGPTADGRLKPDLVATGTDGERENDDYSVDCDPCDPGPACPANASQYIWSCWPDPNDTGEPNKSYAGMTGTSCATPVVSGCIALMIEKWRDDCNDVNYLPLPSTIKAVLIQTAMDLTSSHDPCCTTGPDYSSGYGLVDVEAAVELIGADTNDQTIIIEDSILDTDDNDVFEVNVPTDANELKITLVWDDYPGTLNAAQDLINDLDIIVKEPNGTQHYPWTLDPCSPGEAADQNQADRLNNVEQVLVNNPASGIWTVEVNGYAINQTDELNDANTLNQLYSLVTNELPLTPKQPDSGNFLVKNSSDDVVAWFDCSGSLVLKGSLTAGGSCTAPAGSFIVKDPNSATVGYIDNQGNMCVEDYLSMCGNCNPPETAFVVRNVADVNCSCIDFDGNLCLMGNVYENSISD